MTSDKFEASNFEVVSTKSPFGNYHPTHASLRDTRTGETFEWNSRAHRKMRHLRRTSQPAKEEEPQHHPRLFLWSYEPHNVTWWLNLTNMLANIFWTLSGVYATWPSSNADRSSNIVYAAGIIACLFMIASCYFAYVEAINHSHADVTLPDSKNHPKKHKLFVRPAKVYGRHRSPIGLDEYGINAEKRRNRLLRLGYPIVVSEIDGEVISTDRFDRVISNYNKSKGDVEEATVTTTSPNDDADSSEQVELIGKHVKIFSENYVCTTTVAEIEALQDKVEEGYEWWTWDPNLHIVAIVLALIGFISAWVYLVPMVTTWPFAQNNAGEGVTLFFVDILQVIPYICFAAVGHIYIFEAAGSWWKPKLDSIGYYIAVFNTIGAYGFLLCGALAIPGTVGSTCCPNMAKWGSSFACFWGSSFYLVGGILMCIEFANPQYITLYARMKRHSSSPS